MSFERSEENDTVNEQYTVLLEDLDSGLRVKL